MLYRLPFLLLSILFILGSSCNRSQGPGEFPEEAKPYISGFTSGILSKAGPIRIRFTQSPIAPGEVGSQADGSLLKLSPAASGSLYWEDQRTLRFDPETYLEGSRAYTATLQLGKLFPEVPKAAREVDFAFHTREQGLELSFEGLFPTPDNLSSQRELRGVLYTADLAEKESVEKTLEARQEGRELNIRWSHSADRLEHRFTVTGVERTEQPGQLTLQWNGKPVEASESGEQTFDIPGLGDFRVARARVLQEPEQAIVLQFSDPLRTNQNLAGLIRINGYPGNLRYLIDGTEVFVFPSDKLSGTYELTASPGILSTDGNRMKNPSNWTVSLTMPDPAVRLVGKGVIMPESEGLVFPFEAIGLNAVLVEVFKIYDNNILQFLQTNDLDGNDELYRVGKLILQQKVDLRLLNPTAEASSWGRYALDLANLFRQDPDAIYQVRIGFKPSYVRYACANNYTGREEDLEAAFSPEGELTSMLDNWYGFEGYYPNYRWEDRDDPCKPAYYNYEKFIRRNVLTSNLGILAKGNDQNRFLVSVSDLRTTRSISGANITFYDYFQQPIASGQTGSDGTLRISLSAKPFVAVAEKGEQKGYLRLQDGNALSLSRFDVSGTESQKGLKGFLYADRGAWRPGDSVFLNFMLEDEQGNLPEAYPIVMELYNPRNQLVEKRSILQHTARIYDLSFASPKNAPTGAWRVEVKAGGATFRKTLAIEALKPNRLQIDLELGDGERIQLTDGPVRASLSSRWLHGAPASGLEARVEVALSSKRTEFSRYSRFVFDDPTRRIDGRPKTIFKGTLDPRGQARFTPDFLPQTLPSGMLTARFSSRVIEKGGDFSTSLQSMEVSPFDAYVGLSLPENEYRQKRLSIDESGRLDVAVVDARGNPLSNRKLTAEVYRVEWRWWWERNRNNVSTYNYNRNLEEQVSTTLQTGNDGTAEWNLSLEDWGRYLVRICDEAGGHCTGDFLYVGYPYGEQDSRPDDAALLSFTTDKESYSVGEQVELIIPAEENSRAFISLETGSTVLETRWLDLLQGENRYTFRAEPEMAPNVYAHITLIQEHGQVRNDRPIRLYGILPVRVEDPDTRLSPLVKAPEEIRPETDFTVEVSEEDGRPMAYTLAIVDEGLLGITNFRTPDPHGAFYAKEALGIRTWDVYDQVLGAYGGQLDRILSVGGGGPGEVEPEQQEINRFEPVVMHLGPFELKKGQTARHDLRMPNYVGAVRMMVVAGKDRAYGSADATVPVRQPLMVLTTLPRVLGPGERIRIPVNVFAMKEQVRKVTVSLSESSGRVDLASTRQQVTFTEPGNQVVYFEAGIGEYTGPVRFLVEASGGGESATQEIEVMVRNPNPVQTSVVAATLQPGESWTGTFEPVGLPDTRSGYLELSTLPPLNLNQRLDYLIRYPYGCVEQTVSTGFPQLYAGRMIELPDNQQQDMQENVQATIRELLSFQTATGGFGYWPGDPNPDHWSSNYAGHFMLEAREEGFAIPPGLVKNWLDFQKKTARLWEPDDRPVDYGYGNRKAEEEMIQAYRLYTLALAGQADMAAMNRLREKKGLDLRAAWRLSAAYALVGQTEVANRIIQGLSSEVPAYSGYSYTYGSRLRDLAMILETRVLLGQLDQAGELARRISDELGRTGWYSTQTTAYCLLAVGKLVGKAGARSDLSFSYAVGGSGMTNEGSNRPVKTIPLASAQLASTRPVEVKNNGEGLLFVRLVSSGQPLSGEERPRAEGLDMSVAFLDLNGNALDPANLSQGMDFVARVEVKHDGSRPYAFSELALDQIFPSGWEILNTRLSGLDRFQNSDKDYQDIRDDRVYTFFDLRPGEAATYHVQLNAAYQGRYYLPGVHCSAMYDNGIEARKQGQWVQVGLPEGI